MEDAVDIKGRLPYDRIQEMKTVNITGGGLAGLSLGIALRDRGVPVEVREAGSYPRHRVCGEFITGVSEETLERLGILKSLSPSLNLTRTCWYSLDRMVYRRELPRPAWGISRWALDAALAERFTEAGGVLKTGRRIRWRGEPEPGVVWATGSRPAPRGGDKWMGLKIHLRGLSLEDDLELHLGTGGYAGISRIEGGAVNLCGLFRQRPELEGRGSALVEAYLEANGLHGLLRRIRAAEIDEASFCAVAGLNYRLWRPPTPGFVLGDNWALIPPFTGNGMSMAFESAACAVDPLVSWSGGRVAWEDCLKDYRRRLRARLSPRIRRARLLHAGLLIPKSRIMLAWLARKDVLPFRILYALTH